MREINYRPRAAYDVESIISYRGAVLNAPQSARDWYEMLKSTLEFLCDQPELGRVFDDDRLRVKNRRSYLLDQYRIFYSYDEKVLTVWRIVHVRQDIDDYALVDLLD